MKNQKIEPIDLTKVLKGFEDKWIILSDDYSKVLKSGDKAEDILDYTNLGTIMLVPNPSIAFIPKIC